MTQEDKELLLKDLCARLPYNMIGLYSWKKHEPHNRELTGSLFDELKSSWDSTEDSEFLPYLRPLSSMTEEEFFEYNYIRYSKVKDRHNYKRIDVGKFHNVGIIPIDEYLDWLNAHHFDYRGLIEKGIAIEVTKENNPYETLKV